MTLSSDASFAYADSASLRGDRLVCHSRRRIGRVLALLGVLVALAACSSAPDPPDRVLERRNRAAQLATAGNASFARGDLDLALQYFRLALDENVAIDYREGIAQSYNSIGRVLAAGGRIEDAAQAYDTALEIASAEDLAAVEVRTLTNLGELALRRGETARALELFEAAEERRLAGEQPLDTVLLHNIGTLYARLEQFDTAVEYLTRALAANSEAGEWVEIASNHYMLASVASRRGNLDEARRHAFEALEYDRRAENSPGIAADLHAIAQIADRGGDSEMAYRYTVRALQIFVALDDAARTLEMLSAAERLATVTGRDAEAREYARQRHLIEARLAEDEAS